MFLLNRVLDISSFTGCPLVLSYGFFSQMKALGDSSSSEEYPPTKYGGLNCVLYCGLVPLAVSEH
mgnify:CR=1 FL=1